MADKKRLETELAHFSAKDMNSSAGDTANRFPDYGDSEEDNAQEVADFEANMSIEKDLTKLMRDIVSSLARIEKGDYGVCKYCAKPMEEKRLLARPTSSACVACKKTIVQEV